jgi:hypothetical protein
MYPTKKKLRKKSRYGVPHLAATIYLPPRQHLNSRLSKSDALQEGK